MSYLVSICVITYNSSRTVAETLNSIYNQTYNNIELIISDDCSTDNTIEIVTNWITLHKSRFTNTKIITTDKNTGVTGNVNRACKTAKGYYIKDIAGDDFLLPDYITTTVKYFEKNPTTEILFTKLRYIDENGKEINVNENFDFFKLNAKEQFSYMISVGVPTIPTPSVIYKKQTLERLSYFDERIPMWEDGPFYFKASKNNIRLQLVDSVLVIYQIRNNSISHQMSPRHKKSIALFYFYEMRNFEKSIKKKIKQTLKFILFYFSNIKIINRYIDRKLNKT